MGDKIYSRDKRSPAPKSEGVSKVMSANKAKNTKLELKLRQGLWQNGVRGYRLHVKDLPGRPDITFNRKKIAIFVNGCYWHRCPICALPLPKNNTGFWQQKFARNTTRDALKVSQLQQAGWTVKVLWECRLAKDLDHIITEIKNIVQG